MNARIIRATLLIAPLIIGMSGCEWFTDFKRQPMLATWEPVKDSLTPSRGNPQYSVPVNGMAVPGIQVSYAALPGTIDSMSSIPNPTPATPASLANGRKYFQVNCSPCHGEKGLGDGPATKFGMPSINLTSDVTKGRADGYIFGMIRNGRGLMPTYNRIEEPDRWDVVNYLRGLQGRNGQTVPTGPLAAPGVTGDKLYGFSRTGPTRMPPFINARGQILGSGLRAAVAVPAGDSSAKAAAVNPAGPPKLVTDSVKRETPE